MTTFKVGDAVAFEDGCGGQRGEFVVVEVHAMPTPFGTFVTYTVESSDGVRSHVVNGHLRMRRVGVSS